MTPHIAKPFCLRTGWTLISAAVLLSACGGGGGGSGGGFFLPPPTGPAAPPPQAASFSIGGSVSGLNGSLVLRNNGQDDVTLSADGSFTFAQAVGEGQGYAVTVLRQPAGQVCTVSAGQGTATSNVAQVRVACTTPTHTVGGTVAGLLGGGLVLEQPGSSDLLVGADGPFVFGDRRAFGMPYAVRVKQQPTSPPQTCTVGGGTGTIGESDVTDVSVVCAIDTFPIRVTVSGMDAAGGLVLQNNGGDDLPVGANGVATFATRVAAGADYGVTVKSQPAALQVCVPLQAFGTVAGAAVTSVEVRCSVPGPDRAGFAANEDPVNSTVSAFVVGEADGALSTPQLANAGVLAQHLAVNPAQDKVFVASVGAAGNSTVTQIPYAVSGGSLTLDAPVSYAAVDRPTFAVAFHPSGRTAYAVGGGFLQTLAIDSATGLVQSTTTTAEAASGSRKLAVDVRGRFVFVADGARLKAVRVDSDGNVLPGQTQSIATPTSFAGSDIAVEATGRFVFVSTGIGSSSDRLYAYRFDPDTGALSAVNDVLAGSVPYGLAVDPSARFLYAVNRNSNTVSAFAIHPKTGALSPVPGQPFAVPASVPDTVTVDRTGRFAYTANQNSNDITRFVIDPVTGQLAQPVNYATGRARPQMFVLSR